MDRFGHLKSTVKKLSQMNGGLSVQEHDQLLKCIQTGHSYMRTHFAYNIEMESQVASHCVKCAISDPSNTVFADRCSITHSATCHQCDNLSSIFIALRTCINRLKSGNGPHLVLNECQDLEYDVKQAEKAIFHYRHHLLRSYAQTSDWDTLMHEMKPDTCFIIQDWNMKWYVY